MSGDSISPRPGGPGLRASDADREQLISELNEHTGTGRLTPEELESRVEAAYSARTTGELDALRSDLPPTSRQVQAAHAARRAQLTRRLIQETAGSGGAFVLCTAVWLVSGANGQFWPVWILIPILLVLARSAWALYGPAPDLDAVESRLDARREKRRSKAQIRRTARGQALDEAEKRVR
jgi:hypothetical protein